MKFFAHSRPESDQRSWQELQDHLEHVAELAAQFAPDGLAELARTAGLWHDVGKYQNAFQKYIGVDPEASNEGAKTSGVPHAGAGAALAMERFKGDARGLLLALAIQAHHGALKSAREIEDAVERHGRPLLLSARQSGLPPALELLLPSLPNSLSAMSVRMLFSALVDADLLDTEAWDRGYGRTESAEDLRILRDRLDKFCAAKVTSSRQTAKSKAEQDLSRLRQEVFEACAAAAVQPQGAFTLTVPTGGGKTLSGLAFALHHAVRHDLKRVIVVAPYTSILEQTAQVYRDAIGSENVIEHHSNLSPAQDTDHNRQACENWDARVIVTTSVQLLESLHAAHKRPCRKLHRIANSVVLLDEVQTFPTALLQPIHAALKRLIDDFGVTVVHGTATQPLLATATGSLRKDVLRQDLQIAMQEIIPEPAIHFEAMRHRFRMEVMGDLDTPVDPAALAADAALQGSALIITHRRDDARTLADLLGPGCLHLSAAMCAAHRTKVLGEARKRLDSGLPCLLVSTQLIEAGVDIDFPVVYRAMAGLETLAQAAGRCNRAMRLPQPGRFVIYRAGTPGDDDDIRLSNPPPGTPRISMEVALSIFKTGVPDLCDPHLFPAYSRRVLNKCDTDKNGLLLLEEALDFPEVAAKFRMIDEPTISVIAPFGEASERVAELRASGPTRDRYRALQRFTVGLRSNAFNALYAAGWLEPALEPGTPTEPLEALWTVRMGDSTVYDQRFGFPAGEKDTKLRSLIS